MSALATAEVSKGFVEVRDFGLSYDVLDGEVEAVRDVSIHVRPGEFVSIIGPSGCGKSTLLNAVAGFLKPTIGTVTVDGEPVNGPSADRGRPVGRRGDAGGRCRVQSRRLHVLPAYRR